MSIFFAKHRLLSVAPLLVATLLSVPALASTTTKPKGAVAPISMLQKLRQLLDLNQPIATGGSRSGGTSSICVINPRVELKSTGDASGLILLGNPTLAVLNSLNEIQIERDDKLVWQKLAKSGQPITRPIPWPLSPIQPNETVKLRLRPQGASGADFANITLRGAPAELMEANSRLVKSLGNKPETWINSIAQQLEQSKYALARAILFAPEAPNSASIDELRQAVGSCAR